MKHALPIGLLIAVAVAGAVAFGLRRSPEAVPVPPTKPPEESASAVPVAPEPPAPPATAAGRSSVDLVGVVREQKALAADPRGRAGMGRGTQGDQQARRDHRALVGAMADEVKLLLSADPSAWPDVVTQLSRTHNVRLSTDTAKAISGAVDESAWDILVPMLRDTATPAEERRVIVALLTYYESPATLPTLMEAARNDPDAGVRFGAITYAWHRKSVVENADERAAIENLILERSRVEPDPGVKRRVAMYLPGGQPKPPYRGKYKKEGGNKLEFSGQGVVVPGRSVQAPSTPE